MHDQGVLHLDLKPQNVMVLSTGAVVLLDLGLSAGHAGLTGRDRLDHGPLAAGTLATVAPEQLRGEEIDARSDYYAFGAMLYMALTGSPPFASLSEKLSPGACAPSPGTRVDGIPPALETLLLHVPEKEGNHEHARCLQIADARRVNLELWIDRGDPGSAAFPAALERGPRAGRREITCLELLASVCHRGPSSAGTFLPECHHRPVCLQPPMDHDGKVPQRGLPVHPGQIVPLEEGADHLELLERPRPIHIGPFGIIEPGI